MVVLTARPWRRQGLLVDFPGQLTRAAEAAGLVAYERNVALLVGLRDDRLVGRPSFFQLDRVRKARARGIPLRIIAHEDVLAFRRPPDPRPPQGGVRMPGRYRHNQDPALAALLHQLSLEGWANNSAGDIDQDGFHASLIVVEPAEPERARRRLSTSRSRSATGS